MADALSGPRPWRRAAPTPPVRPADGPDTGAAPPGSTRRSRARTQPAATVTVAHTASGAEGPGTEAALATRFSAPSARGVARGAGKLATPVAVDYWRQVDLIRPEQLAFPVTVVGVGGIGSPVALALAKMGCPRLTLYDPDVIEPHNLPSQLYRVRDVGRPKVEALAEILRDYAPVDVTPIQAPVDGQRLEGVVISAVDSMAAREAIWRGSVRFRGVVPLYVDARMGGEVGRVLAVRPADPDQVRAYEATLYGDEAAVDDPCTAQAIVYNTLGIAALVANQVKRFARDEPVELDTILDFATLSLLTGCTTDG